MTLPAYPNAISMSQVAAELGVSATGLSLNASNVRSLAGKASGAISFSDLHGKSAFVALTGATVGPSTATGSGVQGIRCYTNSVSASPTPSNASGPITYAWEWVSGSTFSVTSSSAASTTFSYIPTTAVGARSGVYRCKVMQGATTYYTSNVSITIDWG